MTRVNVALQVEEFVRSLAPEPRRRLRLAIRALANDAGDIKRLEGCLEGYSRLRVAGYRVIFAERAAKGARVIDCVWAEKRSVVYELFIRLLSEGLAGDEKH
jgi:mRNA-degrading endonuclease RelE of RelBE toxin-antitoxin system